MALIRKNWFLLALAAALLLGFFFAGPATPIADVGWVKWSIVLATMFVMAWPIALGDLRRTLSQPGGWLLASVINLGLIPILAWPLSKLLGAEFGPGLIVVAATPATLASAAVWTRRAGGNDGIAIMVTIVTNMVCFLVTPFWVFALTGIEIEKSELYGTIYKLLLFVVLPIFVAQAARVHNRTAKWATTNKPRLSIAAQIGILLMVFLGAVKTGARLSTKGEGGFDLTEFGLMIATVAVLHIFVLWLALASAKGLKFSRADQIGIGIAGSQKTLMVGLSVALSFGISILPLVAYHTIQLIYDTFVVEHFKRQALASQPSEK